MLENDILKIIRSSSKPIKAIEIGEKLDLSRKEINRCLYSSPLFDNAEVDENGFWSFGEKDKIPNRIFKYEKQPIRAEAYFSPRDKCKEIICKEIKTSTESIKIQAFTFHCPMIAKALIKKKKELKNDIDIALIVWNTDIPWSKRKKDSDTNFINEEIYGMFKSGVRLFSDDKFNHNKYMVIDKQIVITGSMNFNKGSEFNRENMVIIRDAGIAAEFNKDWEIAKKDSEHIKKVD